VIQVTDNQTDSLLQGAGSVRLSISEAARRAGVQRQTLYRKIKSGAISTVQGEDGQPLIDLSELARLFPAVVTSAAPPVTAPDSPADSLLQAEIKHLRERLDAAERDRDAWRDQARQLARLAPPAGAEQAPRPGWWQRLTRRGG
jgi:transposase-like protein